jgi:hypothetical protein
MLPAKIKATFYILITVVEYPDSRKSSSKNLKLVPEEH